MEEIPLFSFRLLGKMTTLFFDPNGRTLYAELEGTLYEWDLQKDKHGPEWWIGEE